MGFPVDRADRQQENRGDPELHDFRTWVDGSPVTVQREGGWITWSVPFEAGQTRTVRNSYWAGNYHNSVGMVSTGYILKTGATWKGPIGEAVIIAEFQSIWPGQVDGALPSTYRWEGDRMVWRMREFEPDRDVVIWLRTRPERDGIPDPFLGPIYEANWKGGADGLRVLREARRRHPNHSDRPDELDLTLAKLEYLYGDREAARQIARRALELQDAHSVAAYIAIREGWRRPAELLAMEGLPLGMRRYLMDAGGFEGEPPAMPALTVEPAGVELLPTLLLADPDGDLDDWGITVWASPDEQGEPLFATRGFEHYWEDRVQYRQGLFPRAWTEREAAWFRAWATDSRGHRVETPLTRIALREAYPAAPSLPEKSPAPAITPTPGETAQPVVTPEQAEAPSGPAGGWLLALGLALLALLTVLAFLHRRAG